MKIQIVGLDLNDIWEKVAEAYLTIIDDQFKTEGAAYGEKWEPSARVRGAEARQAERLKKGEGKGSEGVSAGQTLQRDGVLRNSPTFRREGKQIVFTSNLDYSAIHKYGGVIKPKSKKALRFMIGDQAVFAKKVVMPQRDYMPMNDKVVEELMDEIVMIITRSPYARRG